MLRTRLYNINLINRHFGGRHRRPIFILQIRGLQPHVRLIQRVRDIVVPRSLPRNVTPTHASSPTLFVTFGIPQYQISKLVSRHGIFVHPVRLRQRRPRRPTIHIRNVFFVGARRSQYSVNYRSLTLPYTLSLAGTLQFRRTSIFPVGRILRQALHPFRRKHVTIIRIVRRRFTSQRSQRTHVVMPNRNPSTTVLVSHILRHLGRILSRFFHVKYVSLVHGSIIRLRFRPHVCLGLPCIPTSPRNVPWQL